VTRTALLIVLPYPPAVINTGKMFDHPDYTTADAPSRVIQLAAFREFASGLITGSTATQTWM